ncbi:MAG: PD40 domain-containing protein [Deltaproteobacteria bacterium]|nr:PD40 domain-containing protein [Deltaproteobacteria bacterium]
MTRVRKLFVVSMVVLPLMGLPACGGGGGGGGDTTVPTIPKVPSGVTATAKSGEVTLRWNPVAGATSYNIYWATSPGAGNGTEVPNATSPYDHKGLANGTTYYYVVTSVNVLGESQGSSEVSATPTASGGGTGTESGFKNVDLVFSNGGDLYGMNADGSGKVVLKASTVFDGYDYFSEMAFSADGQQVAYTAECGGNGFIRVMGSDLGNPTDLTTRCSAGAVYSASSPAFSPDGTKIAFIGAYNTATEKGRFLSIMNADGTNQHRVTPLAIDPDLPGDGYYNPDERSPSFSADGSLIVFTTNRGNGTQLATIHLDGTNMKRVDGGTAPGGGSYATDPTPFDPTVDWSTDTIYYSSAQVSVLNSRPNIYRISLTGSDKVGPLTNSSDHPLYRPSVSQDGRKVAFTEVVGFSEANILVLDLDTLVVTTISNTAFSTYNDYPVFVRR